jgi:hypothetical protein
VHRPRLNALVGLLFAASCRQPEVTPAVAGTPALYVETARVLRPDVGGPGRLLAEGRFTGLTVDPRWFARLDIGDGARWVRLRRRRGGVLAVRSREHGYALALDLRRGRFTLEEADVVPENPLTIRLGQEPPLACTMVQFREAEREWTFDHTRDRQLACPTSPSSLRY